MPATVMDIFRNHLPVANKYHTLLMCLFVLLLSHQISNVRSLDTVYEPNVVTFNLTSPMGSTSSMDVSSSMDSSSSMDPTSSVGLNTSSSIDPTASTHHPSTESESFFSNFMKSGFVHAFVASLSVILVSEIGDKTFFIAAIMAMQHSRLVVFFGAISALALMTILSAVFGLAATFIPHIYTFYISTGLFVFFGMKMLWDGYHMTEKDARNEFDEVQSDINRREIEMQSTTIPQDTESTNTMKPSRFLTWKVILQAFTMTFLAEWGDRSQVTTIVLAAREDIYGIMVGGCLGHAICTGAAVIGGRLVAQKISVKHVTLIGGVVFLIFAVVSLIMGPNDEQPTELGP